MREPDSAADPHTGSWGHSNNVWKDLAPPFSSCWLGLETNLFWLLRACRKQAGKVEMLYILEPLLSWESVTINILIPLIWRHTNSMKLVGMFQPTYASTREATFRQESVSWCITFLHYKTYHMVVEDNTHLSFTVFSGLRAQALWVESLPRITGCS